MTAREHILTQAAKKEVGFCFGPRFWIEEYEIALEELIKENKIQTLQEDEFIYITKDV